MIMETIDFLKPRVHVFICVNDRTGIPDNTKPSCGPRITPDDVKAVKRWIQEQGWTTQVYCTKSQCLGFCNPEGSCAVVYPEGRFVKGIQNVDDIKQLVKEEVKQAGIS